MNLWEPQHDQVMTSFLKYLNEKSDDFILKGGTALLKCYGLDRFSEDIDLDGCSQNIEGLVSSYCKDQGYSYRVAKDTDTTKRYMLDYQSTAGKKLKIETSYRRKNINEEETTRINNIRVYRIDTLCLLKCAAYQGRDKIRDLYDLCFICDRYFDSLTPQTKAIARVAIEYKGIEQFDYLLKTQQDELINESRLTDSFLSMYSKLGLIADKEEVEIMQEAKVSKNKNLSVSKPLQSLKKRTQVRKSEDRER